MKCFTNAGSRWRTIMVLAPLVLLVILAIAASGSISAGSAQYVYAPSHFAPASQYGVSDQMLYVANGRDSSVAIIDVGTMSIVDKVMVPNQPTPATINSWNPGLMNWEIHGAVPGKNAGFGRTNVYAVGAMSAGSYDAAGNFRLADYRLYDVNTATDAVNREIPMQGGPNSPINPVGFCGLEYNLNDENSNEIVGANMNISNETGMMALTDPATGAPIDLGGVRGSGPQEHGGWAYEDIATGTNTGNLDVNQNATDESSTCGIAWDASGTHGFASQQFEPLVDKVDWNPATGTGTVAGEIAPFTGANLQHQEASDKANDRLYVTDSDGNIYVYAMSTGAEVAAINMRTLTGTTMNNVHGVEVSPSNPDVIYVTSRYTPDMANNMELVVDITSMTAPKLLGSVNGLTEGACGVYAIANKGEYYGTQPALTLSKTNVYWASYADYTARKLSVDYSIGNGGTAGAANVTIVGSSSSNGVTIATGLPASAGNIAGGASASTTLQYNVPVGTSVFSTKTYATAQNGATVYAYPGPYPGA